jgi:hypothetical protein
MITHLMIHAANAERTACIYCRAALPGAGRFEGARVGKVVAEHGGTRTWPAGAAEQTPDCTDPSEVRP